MVNIKVGTAQAPGRQKEKARKSREVILDATMRCLARYGYAETSTTRITEEAGVSRGLLTHHFPSKERLMVEATSWIIRTAVNLPIPSRPDGDGSDPENLDEPEWVRRELYFLWDRVVNTEQTRALVEILMASRTNAVLNDRIRDVLVDANERVSKGAMVRFASVDDNDERFVRLWTIARVFFRGLITHDAFVQGKSHHRELVDEFIGLIAPLLKRRTPLAQAGFIDVQ